MMMMMTMMTVMTMTMMMTMMTMMNSGDKYVFSPALEVCSRISISADEEFKVPLATGCEDTLPHWKERPYEGEICGPPAQAGKFNP